MQLPLTFLMTTHHFNIFTELVYIYSNDTKIFTSNSFFFYQSHFTVEF